MERLLRRILARWTPIEKASFTKNWRVLGQRLDACAKDSDRGDLRANDGLKHRIEQPHGGHTYDLHVVERLCLAMIERLAQLDGSIVYETATTLANINPLPREHEFDYTMGLVLASLQIEREQYQDAVNTAERNRKVSYWCPYSQYYIYLAFEKSKTAGIPVSFPRFPIIDSNDGWSSDKSRWSTAVSLNDRLARHLHSTDGAAGMDRLLSRVFIHWGVVERAWFDRDFRVLGQLLDTCGKDSDRGDIRTNDVFKLRTEQAYAQHSYDFHVVEKICRAMLEELAKSNGELVYDAALKIAYINPQPLTHGFDFTMGLVLASLQIERGLYQEAVNTAERNRKALYWCPYSQYYIYIAVKKSKEAGLEIKVPIIPIVDLSDRFCPDPFNYLSTLPDHRMDKDWFPRQFICRCPAGQPFALGDGSPDQKFDDTWNGEAAQEIRRSILDGDFTYCGRQFCSEIFNGTLPKRSEVQDPFLRDVIDNHKLVMETGPRHVQLAHDPSCNLACPSCRSELFSIKNDKRDVLARFKDRVLLPLLEHTEVAVHISGDGDPFFSKHYREIVRGLDPIKHANATVCFLTNGQLFTQKEWDYLSPTLRHLDVRIGVSTDAASAAVYEDVRRPGKWNILLENFELMSRLRKEGLISTFTLNFVVQKKNYRDMPDFVRLAQKLGVDEVWFMRMHDTHAVPTADFNANNILDERHPEHGKLLEMLRDPIFEAPQVVRFTMQPYFDAAMKLDAPVDAR